MENEQEYLDRLNAECEKLEEDIARIKRLTLREIRKREAIEEKLADLKAENRIMLRERGWEGITDEEMKWVMAHHDEYYFKLTLGDIRRLMKKEKNENIS